MTAEATHPQVTIGLPVYNGERYLAEALDSLLAQTFADFALVISDNGSTDATREICESYATRDGRIRYHRSTENLGAARNFNRVFELSSSPYFRWAAYDDLCAPMLLERCVQALDEAPPSVVLCYPKTRFIDEDGGLVRDHDDGLDLRSPSAHARFRRYMWNIGYANPIYGLIRATALRRTRMLGGYPSADIVLLGELALLGEFWEIPEPLFLRREHPAMSRLANRSTQDIAAWFDPAKKRKVAFETWRLLEEFLVSIHRAPVGHLERLLTYGVFAPIWLLRHAKSMLLDLRQVVALL